MIAVLCGGFGAARFVEGLSSLGADLTCVVNVADDFDYVGVRVCPDLDSVLYALAGRFDEIRGWGPVDDSMVANEALARYGDGWFHLGDKDLTLSLERTARLRQGRPLSDVTAELVGRWGIAATLLPATDQPVGTVVRTPDGWRTFQDFVVRERANVDVLDVRYEGVAESLPAPGVVAAIERADVVVIAPSNPISSIGPILAVPGVRRAIAARDGPNVAVSPVVVGREPETEAERSRAVLRRVLMLAAGAEHRPSAVAAMYRDLIDGFVVDERDHPAEELAFAELRLPVLAADTLNPRGPARDKFAAEVLRFGAALPLEERRSSDRSAGRG
jgi:LPPG:FO 2-phospho-L-lactate transferase